jgi:hypothetical protein
MDITALKHLYLTVPVSFGGEIVTATFNAAKYDAAYHRRVGDRRTPFTTLDALEHLEAAWDLSADGVPLAPMTAENLAQWLEQYPWLDQVVGAVYAACLDAISPKALAGASLYPPASPLSATVTT